MGEPMSSEEWVANAVRILRTPGLLSPEDQTTVHRHLHGRCGAGLDDIETSTRATAAEKQAALAEVTSAVAASDVKRLVVRPKINPPGGVEGALAEAEAAEVTVQGRVNPLAAPATVETPVIVLPKVERNGNGHPVTGGDDDRAAALMLEAFKSIARGVTPAAPAALDEDKVKALAQEVSEALLAEKLAATQDNITTMLAAALARIEAATKGQPQRIEVSLDGGKVIDLGTEPRHWQFEQVLTWLAAGVPVWLWGKAGSGKTHMARQLAEALDLEVTVVSVDPTMTVGKLVGYRNLATGEYVEGFLLKPFRDGGLLMLDEIDTGDPGIIACLNALLANGHYLFPNGETITRHPKFRILAGANTKGTGAVAGYTARQKLDAATLDRFGKIELVYDERLEEILCCGDSELVAPKWNAVHYAEGGDRRWVHWVRKARKTATSVLISPRATYLGVKALRAGIPVAEVAEALVFALVADDTRQNIIQACGRPS